MLAAGIETIGYGPGADAAGPEPHDESGEGGAVTTDPGGDDAAGAACGGPLGVVLPQAMLIIAIATSVARTLMGGRGRTTTGSGRTCRRRCELRQVQPERGGPTAQVCDKTRVTSRLWSAADRFSPLGGDPRRSKGSIRAWATDRDLSRSGGTRLLRPYARLVSRFGETGQPGPPGGPLRQERTVRTESSANGGVRTTGPVPLTGSPATRRPVAGSNHSTDRRPPPSAPGWIVSGRRTGR